MSISVSNHRQLDHFLNISYRLTTKNISTFHIAKWSVLRAIHRWIPGPLCGESVGWSPVGPPHKWPMPRKALSGHDVIMNWGTHPKTISMHICTRTITCLVIQFGANSCTHLNARFVSYYAINTPRGRGKMATILQTSFSNWFSFLQKILDFF